MAVSGRTEGAGISVERIIRIFLNHVELAATIGAFYFGTVAGNASGSRQVRLIEYGISCTATVVVLQYLERRSSARVLSDINEGARVVEHQQEQLLSGLAPIARHGAKVGGLPAGVPREVEKGRLDESVAVAVAAIHPGARGMFYAFDSTSNEFKLVSERPVGAPVKITSSDPQFPVLAMVKDTGHVYSPQSEVVSPFWAPIPPMAEDRVVLVRVAADNAVLGVLALDAKIDTWKGASKGFSQREIRQVLVYADLLAGAVV
jgi:hypothetical protein